MIGQTISHYKILILEGPFTFTSTFPGIGTGGLSIGGSGIVQLDVAAGLMITL